MVMEPLGERLKEAKRRLYSVIDSRFDFDYGGERYKLVAPFGPIGPAASSPRRRSVAGSGSETG